MKKIIIFILLFLSFLNISYGKDNLPSLFLFLGGDEASLHQSKLNHLFMEATGTQKRSI